MKAICKLIPAALALVALASCSNDDFSANGAIAPEDVKATMNVTVEDLLNEDGGKTRAVIYARTGNNNAINFTAGDVIRAYDQYMNGYDDFKFSTDKFVTTTTNVESHAVGVFPASTWASGGTVDGSPANGVKGFATIKPSVTAATVALSTFSLELAEEAKVGTASAWTGNIPLWGATTDKADTKSIEAPLEFVTGLLKIQLEGISTKTADAGNSNYVEWVKVSTNGDNPITGKFETVLKAGEKATLKKSTDPALAGYYGKEMLVKLPEDYAGDYIVYVPIVAATYSDLTVAYGNGATTGTGTAIYTYTNKEFKRGTVYSSNLAVKFTTVEVGNTEQATLAIENNVLAGETGNSVIVKSNGMSFSGATSVVGNTIYLPTTDKDVYLDFAKLTATTANDVLFIKQKEGATFTGKLTLKLATPAAAATASVINVDLPNSEVILSGDFTNASNSKVAGVTVANAKKLTFGDGSTTTAINPTTLTLHNTIKELTIAHNATVTTGTLQFYNATTATNVSVSAPTTIVGKLAGNMDVAANVTVATEAEAEAITGTVTFNGNATLTLTQGYINAINVPNAKAVTLVNSENQGLAAIKSVTHGETGTFTVSNASKWNGAVITIAAYVPAKDVTTTQIWTASQLASIPATAITANTTMTQMANIDLQNKAWAGLTLTSAAGFTFTYDGNSKTISNLSNAATGSNAVGLFNTVTGGPVVIENLTLSTVTMTKALQNGVGALVGEDNASTSTYSKIVVTGATIGANADIAADKTDGRMLGGLIGLKNTGAATIRDSKVTATINGYSALGGFIGEVYGDAAATEVVAFTGACDANVTFAFKKQYSTAATSMRYDWATSAPVACTSDATTADPACGMIGTYVGTVNATAVTGTNKAATVNIGAACTDSNPLTAAKKAALNFEKNLIATAYDGIYAYYKGAISHVGYSPNFEQVSYYLDGVQVPYTAPTVFHGTTALNLYTAAY